ncbi:MMPL family transporter [Phyllobacterium endophyticum]|uniref:Acriflavine resistance protein B n=2 Tax=Phyllobacterium endophyticum TaxID=1149773 RepID=A0A2P7AR10_9HYPH|nr:acriflavine resistance protein B [Phyllobacterium endophyticum]TYR44555.1 MMPL family transporter [Phyllobacterium endophyticum]
MEKLSSTSFSAWFIRHPVATILLTISVVLMGVFALPNLPVAPLPEADFPTIQVTASLPGASPETMASSVATPLEVAFTGVPGIVEMTSTSALGQTNVTIQFNLSKNIDTAAQEVQAAINSVAGRLPQDLPNLPTWRKVNPTDGPVMVLAVTSQSMPTTELSDIADTQLGRQIGQISGVAQVFIAGQQKPAMRIQAQPDRLAAYGLTLADIRTAVQSASVNQAKGAIFSNDAVLTIETNDQLFTADEYKGIVVTWRNGAPVRLIDVANVIVGPEDAYVGSWPDGQAGLGIIILRQPGANIIEIADAIQAALPRLTADLPADVQVSVLNDRTRTIRSSLHEVELTLVITLVLVVGVMGLFLRQVAATAIVAVVLGTSIVATFAVMYLLGFSLNNLTLVALVIAIGFVVDDAIVVVENIHRHMELGAGAVEAALEGAREVGFTVISISLSLVAAFTPLLFMGGIVGRLFREFSLTVAISLAISVASALTVAPMLCAQFMKAPAHARSRGKPTLSDRLVEGYARALRLTLRHKRLTLAVFLVTVGVTVAAYIAVPKGFFPLQDTAFVTGNTIASEDISYEDMRAKHLVLSRIIQDDPAVQRFTTSIGRTGGSQSLANGRFWIVLKDRGDRDVSSEGFITRIRSKLAGVPGIAVQLRSAQDINLGVGGGGAQYNYVVTSPDPHELAVWTQRLTQAMSQSPVFRDVRNDMQLGARVQRITIDRVAAARFGLSVEAIDDVLYDSFGQRQISEYQTQLNQYRIIVEVDPAYFSEVSALNSLYVRSAVSNALVPLSSVAKIESQTSGPLLITRTGQSPAANISFNLPAGTSLGDAVAAIEPLKAELGVPSSVTGKTQGTARAFEDSLATQPYLILAAIFAVYVILGVLYESFSTPLTILSTLPSAGLGAIGLLWLWGLDFSIMALIGVVLLIGIVKKNGILMVDFALNAQRTRHLDSEEAIYAAAVTRFRPIIMTTIAALLAAVPLMLAFGTGAELRQPLGVAVVGGLVVSQALTLFSTPVIYIILDRLFSRPGKTTAISTQTA